MKRNPWTGRLPIFSVCSVLLSLFLSLRNTTRRTMRESRGRKITESKACNKKQHVLSLFPEHKSFATFANVLVNREHRNRERANRCWWGHRGKTLNHRTAGGHGRPSNRGKKNGIHTKKEYEEPTSFVEWKEQSNCEYNAANLLFLVPFCALSFLAVFKRLSGAVVKWKRIFGYLTCQMT